MQVGTLSSQGIVNGIFRLDFEFVNLAGLAFAVGRKVFSLVGVIADAVGALPQAVIGLV